MADDHIPTDRIDFHAAKPGDICNAEGDIRGTDESIGFRIIKRGVVWVTEAQAEFAKSYGWEECGRDGDLLKVQRP